MEKKKDGYLENMLHHISLACMCCIVAHDGKQNCEGCPMQETEIKIQRILDEG